MGLQDGVGNSDDQTADWVDTSRTSNVDQQVEGTDAPSLVDNFITDTRKCVLSPVADLNLENHNLVDDVENVVNNTHNPELSNQKIISIIPALSLTQD